MSSPISIALSSYEKTALINVIKGNPTWKTVDQLGDAFVEQATAKPYDVDKIANAIAALEVDSSVPLIKTTDFNRKPVEEPINQVLRGVIFDLVKRQLSDNSTTVEPKNTLLISALISGACIRSGLCNSSTQSGTITLGLRFKDTQWKEIIPENESEIWAIHACLHLLVGGTRIYREEQIGYRQEEVLPALKSVAEQDLITNPQGKALLQATIAEAETGFQQNLPIADIWKILFPES
ncbi:hypothetical protein BDZ97DRAFT_1917389 [Flammula alnicola]|nr:hypothetical protein BDZ97DRAFT_1917389 [Flammula alnicola]